MRYSLLLLLVAIAVGGHAEEPAGDVKFRDEFTNAKLDGRRALRGDWQIADGVASCKQNDALYKQYQDHGPIIFYDVPHEDAVVQFRYKAEACKTFVFTMNGEDGHVFRFITSDRGTNLRAFPPEGEAKSIALHVDEKRVLTSGDWIPVTVSVKGAEATVQIGEGEPMSVEHPSLARPKTNTSIGFSFGTLAVKEFSLR